MVAAGASLVVRVELRRDNFLYINDGVYGSLSDLKYAGLRFPMRVLRPDGGRVEVLTEDLGDFSLFGPTCDPVDVMEGPYRLTADVREGDYIEIGQAGAYTTELRTDFNGFFSDRFVEVADDAFLPSAEMEPCEILKSGRRVAVSRSDNMPHGGMPTYRVNCGTIASFHRIQVACPFPIIRCSAP